MIDQSNSDTIFYVKLPRISIFPGCRYCGRDSFSGNHFFKKTFYLSFMTCYYGDCLYRMLSYSDTSEESNKKFNKIKFYL